MLCNATGLARNFEIYKGKIEPSENFPDNSPSSNSVLRPCEIVPQQKNHIIYFDNWFTSVFLLATLDSVGIYALESVQENRLKGSHLDTEK